MKHPLIPVLLFTLLGAAGCDNAIKNEAAVVEVEEGTKVTDSAADSADRSTAAPPKNFAERNADPLGFWVGDFRPVSGLREDQEISPDMGFTWSRNNKINISIDAIRGDSVFGHSVVAGNDRPFSGTIVRQDKGTFYYVKEPGDDRYDGAFEFQIVDNQLIGTWTAYENIDIKERRYRLDPKAFTYDPAIDLERVQSYIDWTKSQDRKYEDPSIPDEYREEAAAAEWIVKDFASSTNLIYTLNASAERLTKAQVENLKKGDLTIIRNTIYARHGYSFKNRPLRVFFDAQPWYIPVHADIKADFTDIEKENIQLLLKYEKNAAEYYDYFGRG